MDYANRPLSELAISLPMATEIFRRARLDFCCGGKQTLKDACVEKNIDVSGIIEQLARLDTNTRNDLKELPPAELVAYIVERYHQDLRKRLPELVALAQKVERVHADHFARPQGLTDLLQGIQEEMLLHMMKEENVLFPMIEAGRGALAFMPVRVMMSEHESHGHQLERLRRLTADFTPPEGACATWKALYTGLEKLEEELMEHIHLENNILFPTALANQGT